MNLRATANRVIIKKDSEEEVRKGGLILPTSINKQHTGKVIGMGPGKCSDLGVRIPMDFQVGDHVVYNCHGGQPIKVGEEEFHVFYDHDIFAVIE